MSKGRLAKTVRLLAVANLMFLLGVGASIAYLDELDSLTDTVSRLTNRMRLTGTGDWFFVDIQRQGVLRHDPARAQAGYTLVSVVRDMEVRLIDMQGRVVHRWQVPTESRMKGWMERLRTAFGLLEPHLDTVHVYPNGDVLVLYGQPAIGKYGSSVIKLDKDSNVLWRYVNTAHHALTVAGDRIYLLTQEKIEAGDDQAIPALRDKAYLDDRVTVLDQDGVELSSYSILDMMHNTPSLSIDAFMTMPGRGREGSTDPVHANDLEVLTEATAPLVPNARPGNVLISAKHMNAVLLADLGERTIPWVLHGHFRLQHDIDMLPNGHFMVFDNFGNLTSAGRSRVLEIERNGAIAWSYEGAEIDPLFSGNRGSQQRLANGNTLISEANGGRLLEVTPDREVVWEYLHGFRAVEDDKPVIASLALDVRRYDAAEVPFIVPARAQADAPGSPPSPPR